MRLRPLSLAVLLSVLGLSERPPTGPSRSAPLTASALAAPRVKLWPLAFEPNVGQVDEPVRFVARRRGTALFLSDEGATLSLRAPHQGDRDDASAPVEPDVVLTLRVAGGRRVSPTASHRLTARASYFVGADPSKWRRDVPTFGEVRYPAVIDGVDLVYHGEEGQLEYDFVVAPGADPGAIALEVGGAQGLSLTPAGELCVLTARGRFVQPRPRVFQRDPSGAEREVVAGYRLVGDRAVGFEVAAYDRASELVIDPVLAYSSYLGGTFGDASRSIAADSDGNTYVAGWTQSAAFPTLAPYQAARRGLEDAFVAKLDPTGALVYSTYLGGASIDGAYGVAVDAAGSAYVTGGTNSIDFPTVNAMACPACGVFVTKLAPAGNDLIYSTYVGGFSSNQRATAIAVDGLGSAYITGFTTSTSFMTVNPIQAAKAAGLDSFVSKLSPTGSSLVFSTYLGGALDDLGYGIAVDGAGNTIVTGWTQSTDFPMANAFQVTSRGGSAEAFVSKLRPDGTAFVYSTYLGSTAEDRAYGVAADAAGNAYVTGMTSGPTFPTMNAVQPTLGGATDAFVTKLNPAGSALIYSTFLGGPLADVGAAIAVDRGGRAYVGGLAKSGLPVLNAIQPTFAGGNNDAFAARLTVDGRALAYVTYLGGGGTSTSDAVNGIAADDHGTAYLTGDTSSTTFRTSAPAQAALGGGQDGFVAAIRTTFLTPETATVAPLDTQTFVATGGDGAGFVFAFETNASGGTLDPATGVYVAGPVGGVTDVITMTDSEGLSASARITVTSPVTDAGADGAPDASLDASGDGAASPDASTADAGDGGPSDASAVPDAKADAAPPDASPAPLDAAMPAADSATDSGAGGSAETSTGAGCSCGTTPAAPVGPRAGSLIVLAGALLLRRRRLAR
ncbi:MAG: SBBP repeat-containing protein [Myxococcales bacterium]|nr:SBBP repeat-containing protein [Myxococcales bacterium]